MSNSGLLAMGRRPGKVDVIYTEYLNSTNTATSATSVFCDVLCIIMYA